jgi:iron complex transport system substrate-binding protein
MGRRQLPGEPGNLPVGDIRSNSQGKEVVVMHWYYGGVVVQAIALSSAMPFDPSFRATPVKSGHGFWPRVLPSHYLLYLTVIMTMFVLSCVKTPPSQQSALPTRIVSLAPSITETLFALGLGDRIIGVTGYCVYPPQARTIAKIGGYADANLEKIVSMRPDLVVLSYEHEKQRHYLEGFNIPVVAVGNTTCAEVCSTFAVLGRRCGVPLAADSLIKLFSDRLSTMTTGHDTLRSRPKVLFCVGRDNPGGGKVSGVFVAGKATCYNDLLWAAGGQNALEGEKLRYARMSMEGVLAAAPTIVIDIASAMDNCTCSLLVRDWNAMERLPAVVNRNVYCLSNDYCSVPGPRLLLLLEDIERIIAAFHREKESAS